MTGLQLVVAVDLVGAGLLHVQHLAPERQNGLKTGVPSLCGRAACRVALDDIDLCQRRVALVAVAQLVGHLAGLESGFAADGLRAFRAASLRAVGHHGLVQNHLRRPPDFPPETRRAARDHRADQRADMRVAELCLGLSLKLRVGELDGDDRRQALAAVLAGYLVLALDDSPSSARMR
jgi:hypothetical protein